ncbi:hypothetical protein RADP37_05559 [Roseomonas mucosa]|uniref:Uncharacterized protein n=1 Tax=Roseomonas mucosa TaxID=207340 RepID=A0A4Y1MYH2_9PROT|nr:hypothetical protein RADP37_05559 [Roseomonas mucosa]
MRRSPPSPPSIRPASAPKRPLQWPDLAEGRLCLERLSHNGWPRLSSPAGCAVIPRETTKSRLRHPPLCCGRKRCVVARLRPVDHHRGRNGAGSKRKTET